ncbi:hypothetical protein F5J12DRAFT_866316 [Pisolithus orientalis]|uniref:uncharacterized protein n=1 Tax=Pisolithus orientalis TaxID=936130 RepID=UPI002224E8E0|nr:uncharacterized protein F5J12DRAFT_866316 [Pisolithus orientalis]KAI5987990.1 hypothetical protein F5J12DRAFT_866316 [Pisolithus orientalis]
MEAGNPICSLVDRPFTRMSTDISDLDLFFCGEVTVFNVESPKGNAFNFDELALFADVPPYHPPSVEVLNVINDTLRSPQAKSELQEAIKNLGDSAHTVEVCFNNVADCLHRAQRQGTEAQALELMGYAEKWVVHRKEYIRLLWESRRVAGHARVVADDFAGNFMNLMAATDVTFAEKKKEIQAYRNQLQEDAKESSNLSQGFYDLKNVVERFQDDVVGFLQSRGELETQVQDLRANLDKIKKDISRLTWRAFFGAADLIGGVVASGLAGVFAVGVLCPLLWIGIALEAYKAVTKGAGLVQIILERKAKTAELETLRKLLEQQMKSAEGMRKIHTVLDPLKFDMEMIKEKLVVFGKIWQLIHTDLNEIERSLDLATGGAGTQLFQTRLDAVSTIYHTLADALYQYETNVHVQNVAELED